jgi:hypothetical protein
MVTRQRSRSAKVPIRQPLDNESNVETVLKSNVKLWKLAQAQSNDECSDSDSVFEDSEGEKELST